MIVFFFCVFTFAKSTDSILISINILCVGFVVVPMIPIGINFSSELTFPIEPTVITGTLMMVGQLGGFILAILAGVVCDIGEQGASYVWIMFTVLGIIASVCSIIIEEDLRKTHFAAKKVESSATNRLIEVHMFDSDTEEEEEEEEGEV